MLVKDLSDGATFLVSASANRSAPNGHSGDAVIGGHGEYVAFASRASNLLPDDANGVSDIFFTRVGWHGLSRVSMAQNGSEQEAAPGSTCGSRCGTLSSSRDGRYIGFSSWSSNLFPEDFNDRVDVFVKDMETEALALASVATDGGFADDASWVTSKHALSDDGVRVAFSSDAGNLVPNDRDRATCPVAPPFESGKTCTDVFVRDLRLNLTLRASVGADGQEANGVSGMVMLSGDGKFAAFASRATNLVSGQLQEGRVRTYLFDLERQQTTLISRGLLGADVLSDALPTSISYDGRLVAFVTDSPNLDVGDVNGVHDVFIYDRILEKTAMASVAADGIPGNAASMDGHLTRGGCWVAFVSHADNLVVADSNQQPDVFLSNAFASRMGDGFNCGAIPGAPSWTWTPRPLPERSEGSRTPQTTPSVSATFCWLSVTTLAVIRSLFSRRR